MSSNKLTPEQLRTRLGYKNEEVRLMYVFGPPSTGKMLRKFGGLSLLEGRGGPYRLVVSWRYDFEEVVNYIEGYDGGLVEIPKQVHR